MDMDYVKFFQMVKENRILYSKNIQSFPRERAQKWQEIGAQLNLSGDVTQKRWKSIKDKYYLLKRREQAYPGTSLGQQLQNSKYAKYLTFLDAHIPKYDRLPPKNRPSRYIPRKKRKNEKYVWNKGETLILIRELSRNPLLFDKTHPYYVHYHHRLGAYQKIADVLKRYRPEITTKLVSKKIRTVRTQYCKEKRAQMILASNGHDPVKPKLWFYDRLTFLDEQRTYDETNLSNSAAGTNDVIDDIEYLLKPDGHSLNENENDNTEEYNSNEDNEWECENNALNPFEEVKLKQQSDKDNLEQEEFDGEIEEIYDQFQSVQDVEESTDDRKQKRADLFVKCTDLLESLVERVRPHNSNKVKGQEKECSCESSSPNSTLGKMIESELKQVSEDILMDAKWKIMRIVEEAQRRNLQEKKNKIM